MKKRYLVVGLFVSVMVACQPPNPEEEATVPSHTMQPTVTRGVRASRTPLPPMTMSPTITATVTATMTPAPAGPPASTETPELPPGLGGLQQPALMQGRLLSGQPRESRLNSGHLDVWIFDANGGSFATLQVGPVQNSLDLNFTLIAPSGRTVRMVDNGYSGERETVTDLLLEEQGRYLLLVGEFQEQGGLYRAALTVSSQPQFEQGGAASLGEVLESSLPAGGMQRWTFSGSARQVVNIVLLPETEQLDVILELISPTNEPLISLDEGFSGDAEVISNLTLPITGEYTVRIYEFGQVGGPYLLAISEGEEPTENFHDAGDLRFGQPGQEMLQSNEVHAWFFQALAGDEVQITVEPLQQNLDLELWLLNPNVERLASSDEEPAGQGEAIRYTLRSTGEHIILVRDFSGRPGSYEIALAHEGNRLMRQTAALSYGQTVTHALPAQTPLVLPFQGAEGEVIAAELTPLDDSDLLITLRDPAGNVLLTVNETMMGQPEKLPLFVLDKTGTWQIVVSSYFGRAGRFELVLGSGD